MTERRAGEIIVFAVRLAAVFVTAGVAIMAAQWLILGQEFTVVGEGFSAGQLPTSQALPRYEPYLPAVAYLIAAVLLGAGLIRLNGSLWPGAAWGF